MCAYNPTCGTCPHWNFKTSTKRSWGQCLHPKKAESCYISVRGFPGHMKTTDEYYQFQKDVAENCEVYFEENFCCIHHPSSCLERYRNALQGILNAVKLAQDTGVQLHMTPVIWDAIEAARKVING